MTLVIQCYEKNLYLEVFALHDRDDGNENITTKTMASYVFEIYPTGERFKKACTHQSSKN